MPSRKPAIAWLLDKEWRELVASRAWWVFLILMGPLVGVSFISAVNTYAEASGLGGTSAGVGEAFSPLVGIWAPTFSACELAAAFLLPFVAIRLVAGDRQSGALKLELQHRMPAFTRVGAKAVVLMLGWLIALLAPFAAVLLWKSYGGSIYFPELATVIVGHLLNAGLTIALASTAAAVTEHPATAAIVTLAVTVGSWIINFIAAVHGGMWERIAGYTPTAMVAEFQHGLVRLDVLLIPVVLTLTGLALAAVWIRLGVAVRRRVNESIAVAAAAAVIIFACTWLTPSWDLSENRMNSFSRADELALRQIHAPLRVEVHLAPEDPRRVDLDRRALNKLRRIMPGLRVTYISTTAIGLFEQASPHYGEIWYELGGRRQMNRATTPEAVLDTVYSLAGATPPESDSDFRGHPLAVPPRGAALVFYGIWPAMIAAIGFFYAKETVMNAIKRRTSVAVVVTLLTLSLSAAETKIDLSSEKAGKPPVAFEPMVGTWVVAEDGKDKVIMVDGRPWVASKDNPTKLLIDSARKLYGTSNEELMDNAKQFAYYPVAILKGVDDFSNGTISLKFKTISGEADRCSGILFNVKPNGDWLSVRYNDTENNVALWEFHNGIRRPVKFSDRAKPFMLDKSAWHELKMTVNGTDFKAWLDGTLALEFTFGSQPGSGRNGGPPNPDLIPANNPVLQPPIAGRIGLWSKTDSTSYFKDYVVDAR